VLHAEIDRLLAIEREWKSGTTVNVNIKESREYIEIYQQYTEINLQYNEIRVKFEALLLENSNLMARSRVSEGSETRITNL
jgi:hypothetical protein